METPPSQLDLPTTPAEQTQSAAAAAGGQQQQPQQQPVGGGVAEVSTSAPAGTSGGGGAAACRSGRPPASENALGFRGKQWLELSESEEVGLDSRELTISAWVRLAPSDGGEKASIQTLVASKASGCDADSRHHGLALFVNAWNTESGQLFLSWGNGKSGCEELATANGLVQPGTWAFVAATIDAAGDAALYVDGVLRASSRQPDLGTRRVASTQSPIDRGAPGTAQHTLRIGSHTDGTHFLRGHLASVSVHPRALEAAGLQQLMCAAHATVQPPPLLLLAPRLKPASGRKLAGASLPTSKLLPSIGVSDLSSPPGGLQLKAAAEASANPAREQVKGVMKRAWGAYRRYAWGADELKPVSNRSHEWLKLGATLVDCLDNLWIMGMHDEFREAREWVATRLSFSTPKSVSMFETVIRILGGLLSAYELSKDHLFLKKSQELADQMMYAFDARSRFGLPCTTISLVSRACSYASWTGQSAILAEFGTIQLEFKYLAHHTGQRKYWDVAQRIMDHMRKVDKPNGLYPVFMSPSSGSWTSQKVTLGALGDSFYEYLIKQWLITNRKEPYLRQMFDEAMVAIAKKLVQKSDPSGYVYIADWSGASLTHKMDHLACFAGAMLAVGAQDGYQYDQEYMALADAIGTTCFKMYSNTATGLSPEFVQFVAGRDLVTPRTASYNIGRPEAAETWFYMWYYTRDPKWREMGWKAFEAFEKYAATGSGWTALPDVDNPSRKRDDKMESFVLAETVKYFYLLFDPDYPVPLEKYVFNTEAHPLGRFDPME